MKGISAIIATILLLLITIAMAGTAYVYISGMLTGKTEKIISALSSSCSQDGKTLTIVVSNDGKSESITSGTDLVWLIDTGSGAPASAAFSCNPATIPPHQSSVCSYTAADAYDGVVTITVTSPGVSLQETIYC